MKLLNLLLSLVFFYIFGVVVNSMIISRIGEPADVATVWSMEGIMSLSIAGFVGYLASKLYHWLSMQDSKVRG